jgi:hypothetical protein
VTAKLTKEFCASRRICFQPRNEAEAAFIQKFLFSIGCAWNQGQTEPLYLDALSRGTLVVDQGRLTYSEERKEDGLLCSAKQIDPEYIADDREFLMSLFNKLSDRLSVIETRLGAIEKELRGDDMDKPRLPRPGGRG